MLVTIFADASFCRDSMSAGWAGWTKSRRGSISHSGPIKHPVHGATEAEMAAIINAVVMAQKGGVAQPGDELLIENDCLDAMRFLEKRITGGKVTSRRCKDPARQEMVKVRETLIRAFVKFTEGHKCRFKHVKGHQPGDTPRSWINNQCDLHARRHMQAVRAEKQLAEREAGSPC